jgi:hypothetical protein
MKKLFNLKNLIILVTLVILAGGVGYFLSVNNKLGDFSHLKQVYAQVVKQEKHQSTITNFSNKFVKGAKTNAPAEINQTTVVEPCIKWVSTNPAPAESICVLDSFKGFETNSDVLVWSYNLNDWEKPTGHGDINTKTVLIAGSEQFGNFYPLYVKCPWGCSFGLIEVLNQ